MQTNKNRNAVAIGALLVAVLVGAFALWSGNNDTARSPEKPDTELTADPDTAGEVGEEASTTGTDALAQEEPAAAVSGTKLTPAESAGNQIPETHTVMAGETLRDIAKKYYNNADYSGYIEAANEMDDPNSIKAGDVIKLPKLDDIKQSESDKN